MGVVQSTALTRPTGGVVTAQDVLRGLNSNAYAYSFGRQTQGVAFVSVFFSYLKRGVTIL